MKPEIFIQGKKIFLRALTHDDVTGPYLGWHNDEEVTRYMYRGWRPARVEELEADYNRTIESDKEIEFGVCDVETKKLIGVAGLHEIDWLTRQTEFRIMIGDKDFWGKGCGAETAKLLLEYAFEKLNLNRVGLGVNAEDPRAIKSYHNAGFVDEGVSRQVIFRNNKYYDAVRMSMLRSEYEAIKNGNA